MSKQLLNFKIICFLVLSFLLLSSTSIAQELIPAENTFYSNQTKLVLQQIDLLKNRLAQAKNDLQKLQKQHDALRVITIDRLNKKMLGKTALDIAIAKSNLDSINIELTECQQAANRIEKDSEELQNQLNALNIFGLKIAHTSSANIPYLNQEISAQADLLKLEKSRLSYLLQLQSIAENMLQLNKANYARIESLLKSQTILVLKEQQAKTELNFEQQQSNWLQRLNTLETQLVHLEKAKQLDKTAYSKIQNDIFYINENVNFTYLQMLIARYQEQIEQLKVSIARGNSITLLNKVNEQAQLLGKQLARVNLLLKGRLEILEKRKSYFVHSGLSITAYQASFNALQEQYEGALDDVANLNQSLAAFRVTLDHALQQELSARQGLPGFAVKAWLDLGGEILLVPSLGFQVFKSIGYAVFTAIEKMSLLGWVILLLLEIVWATIFLFMSYFLRRIVVGIPDHEFGHINLKWLSIKLLHRNLIDFFIIINIFWLFAFFGVPTQNFIILINLSLVWLFFKSIIVMARLCLVETVHDRAGHDVRLYHQLKWVFIMGGAVTAFTVFMHQLPVIYEVKDLFDRLFLLFLLIASIFLLKQWDLVPGLVLPYIDERRTYFRRVIRLLGLLIPLILLVNSIIGLFGFLNLIQTISWYEGVFVCVLVVYLILRGLLNDGMEWVSKILIRHVTNGWLWTEAFLKPVDRVLRIMLFLSAWVFLFLLYGWDQQSPVVERLNKLLHYHLVEVLNTSITPFSVIEITVIISLLYWAARWTREFMYRLLSRTKDLGLRNSIAILTQYAMIVIGVFIGLRLIGIDFRALTVVATAFAFGVGLGLRDLANNFACGFLLLIERPVRVGDIISINGCEGEVTHIGGRAVTVRTWDHMEVIVPNAEIFSKSFTNWTAKDSIVRTVISIKINRHDSPHDVQAVIYQVLTQHKDVLVDPVPEVFLKELADGMVEFEVRYFINLRQVKSRLGLRSEILMAIWEAFERHGIQPPYPHHEIFVKTPPTGIEKKI
jgi:potassium efflux system protein